MRDVRWLDAGGGGRGCLAVRGENYEAAACCVELFSHPETGSLSIMGRTFCLDPPQPAVALPLIRRSLSESCRHIDSDQLPAPLTYKSSYAPRK